MAQLCPERAVVMRKNGGGALAPVHTTTAMTTTAIKISA